MKKDVEKYIAPALTAVRENLVFPIGSGKVYEEYDGYAASFGAAIVTSGLKPALAFYTDVHKDEKDKTGKDIARRWRILNALADILEKIEGWKFNNKNTRLLDYVIDNEVNERNIKPKILAASIALKLALRNFEHEKSPTQS